MLSEEQFQVLFGFVNGLKTRKVLVDLVILKMVKEILKVYVLTIEQKQKIISLI